MAPKRVDVGVFLASKIDFYFKLIGQMQVLFFSFSMFNAYRVWAKRLAGIAFVLTISSFCVFLIQQLHLLPPEKSRKQKKGRRKILLLRPRNVELYSNTISKNGQTLGHHPIAALLSPSYHGAGNTRRRIQGLLLFIAGGILFHVLIN